MNAIAGDMLKLPRTNWPFFLACLPIAGSASSQDKLRDIHAIPLAANIHVIDESAVHGGSVTIIGGNDGTILIDTGTAELAPSVAREVLRVTGRPVRFVINTHAHVDETGGNDYFAKSGATLIGRKEIRDAIINPSAYIGAQDLRTLRQTRTSAPASAPSLTFSNDITLHNAGMDISVIAMPAAHTASDTVISIQSVDIIVAGDLVRANGFPSINRADGGTLAGMQEALSKLVSMAGPNTRIVTSRGDIVTLDTVLAQQRLLGTAVDRVNALIASGKDLDGILSANVTADLNVAKSPGRLTPEAFIRDIYNELALAGSTP